MAELSQAEKDFLLRKHEQTLKLRSEFQKQITNPHRQATGQGGHVFDYGLAHFQAMRVSHYDHFKPTFKAFRAGLLGVVIPIGLAAYLFNEHRTKREHLFRTGQVAYKDRGNKFI